MKTKIAALAALISLIAPLAVSAQVPSYAQSAYGDDQQIRGRIANFDGGYNLQVRDDAGYVDNVQLHQGTIINPTGLTLAPGMVVSIIGYNAGNFFGANEVDTPYSYDAGVPYYSGHPWNYYDSGFTLGFFFGNTGWWHGNDFVGGYSYNRGIRTYAHANFRDVYRGGAFQGRNYVATGGYARGRNVRTNYTTNRTVNTTVINRNVTTTRNTTYNGNAYAAPHTYAAPRTAGNGGYATQSRATYQGGVPHAAAGTVHTYNASGGGFHQAGGAGRPGGAAPAHIGGGGAGHMGGGGAGHMGDGGAAHAGGGGGEHGGGGGAHH